MSQQDGAKTADWKHKMLRFDLECAELIVALNHARRVSWDGSPADHVVEELADVEIMLEQMRHVFESDRIDQVKISKVLRLRDRLRKV